MSFQTIYKYSCRRSDHHLFSFSDQLKSDSLQCPDENSGHNKNPDDNNNSSTNPETKQPIALNAGLCATPPPNAVLIKPTLGTFFKYNASCFLHCGISDSKGSVHNFDERGVVVDPPSAWKNCLAVFRFDPELEVQVMLEIHNFEEKARQIRYHSEKNNCYDYVLRFFNQIQYEGSNKHTKEEIVSKLLGEPVNHFESFYVLHEELSQKQKGAIVTRKASAKIKIQIYICDICSAKITPWEDRFHCTVCEDFDICAACHKRAAHPHKMDLIEGEPK